MSLLSVNQILGIWAVGLLTAAILLYRPVFFPTHTYLADAEVSSVTKGWSPTSPVVFVELGANHGQWTDKQMSQARAAGRPATCYMFEVNPELLGGELKQVAARHNCTVVPYAVWDADGHKIFFSVPSGADQSGSLYTGNKNLSRTPGLEAVRVTTVNITRWFMQNIRPGAAQLHVRMDIEGAEYQVIRRLILSGVACWFDILEFEGHFRHRPGHHALGAVDVAVPWVLKSCGVQVKYETFIPDQLKYFQTPCGSCPYFQYGPLEGLEYVAPPARAAPPASQQGLG